MEQPDKIADIKSPVKRRRTNLPLKTKIAVWWILIVSVGGTIGMMILLDHWCGDSPCPYCCAPLGCALLFLGFLYLISGIILTGKTKSSWIIALVLLVLGLVPFLPLFVFTVLVWSPLYSPIFLLYLIPLILILSDKRNYWIMLSHISAKAKRKTAAVTSGKSQ